MGTLEILAELHKKVEYWKKVVEVNNSTHAQLAYFDFRCLEKNIEESLERQADDMWAKEKGEASHL